MMFAIELMLLAKCTQLSETPNKPCSMMMGFPSFPICRYDNSIFKIPNSKSQAPNSKSFPTNCTFGSCNLGFGSWFLHFRLKPMPEFYYKSAGKSTTAMKINSFHYSLLIIHYPASTLGLGFWNLEFGSLTIS